MAEPLFLYNTLSRTKEEFTPLLPGKVGLYTCGPTVYNYAHIGNLRTYIFEDFLKRTLQFNGFEVNHVMNITDVGHLTSDGDEGEDKLEKGAAREGKTVWDIAAFYTDEFKKNLDQLNIIPPTVWCKATDYISEQIEFIQKLQAKGLTYKTSDGIYFDTAQYPDYATLAKLNIEGQQAGARVEVNPEKRNSTDFALWKFSPKDEKRQMEWMSPWGTGFPGWHIECSAMSIKHLGSPFDIHCGGIDHIPVHHTNERAQNWGLTGTEVVNMWLHGEFLVINEAKMAKSDGNFVTVQTLIDKGFDPLAYRYLCLQTHYRQKLNFSWEALEAAANGLQSLREEVWKLEAGDGAVHQDYHHQLTAAINDDLNMPKALATLRTLLKDSALNDATKRATALVFDEVLGLHLAAERVVEAIPQDILELAKQRDEAKKAKDFATADALRAQIEEAGYSVVDLANGYLVVKK